MWDILFFFLKERKRTLFVHPTTSTRFTVQVGKMMVLCTLISISFVPTLEDSMDVSRHSSCFAPFKNSKHRLAVTDKHKAQASLKTAEGFFYKMHILKNTQINVSFCKCTHSMTTFSWPFFFLSISTELFDNRVTLCLTLSINYLLLNSRNGSPILISPSALTLVYSQIFEYGKTRYFRIYPSMWTYQRNEASPLCSD